MNTLHHLEVMAADFHNKLAELPKVDNTTIIKQIDVLDTKTKLELVKFLSR